MSKASASTSLTLVPEIGTFNAYLLCDKGDLWQNYKGPDPWNTTEVVPNFEQTQPLVSLIVTSSRVSGKETPEEVKWYLGNKLVATVEQSGTSYSIAYNTDVDVYGRFEALAPDHQASNGNYCLLIRGNLVHATGGENSQIRAVFEVAEGTSSAILQATLPVVISEVAENSTVCVIEAGDQYNFQITEKNSSVMLTAKLYRGLQEVTSGLDYDWYKQEYNANPGTDHEGWVEITSKNGGKTLTVQASEVDSAQRFMVRISDKTTKAVYGQDTQMVYDASDFYEIVISRTPSDGQVHKQGDKVTLECAVYKRGQTTAENLGSPSWNFIGATPAGTTVFQSQSSSNQCDVPYDDIATAGGQLEVTVTVEF